MNGDSGSLTPETMYDNCLWGLAYASGEDHRVLGDARRAARIVEGSRCKRCHGTGNELMWMYRACQACRGDGVSRGNEHEFKD